MSYTYSNGTITQTGRDLNLYGLSGSVTTADFTVISGTSEVPGTEVTIKGLVTLTSDVTLTGNGTNNLGTLINNHNNGAGNEEIVLMSGSTNQVLKTGETITIPAGMTGVTTMQSTGGTITYDMGDNKLLIRGVQYQDPEYEKMIFKFGGSGACIQVEGYGNGNTEGGLSYSWRTVESWSKDSDGYLVITDSDHPMQVGDAIRTRSVATDHFTNAPCFEVISTTSTTFTIKTPTEWTTPSGDPGQYIRVAIFHYGREITNGTKTRTSRGDGLICVGDGSGNWNPNTGSLSIVGLYSYLKIRGGTLATGRQLGLGSTVDIKDFTILNNNTNSSKQPLELRSFQTGSFGGVVENFQYVGFDVGNYQTILNPEFAPLDGALIETLGSFYSVYLNNFNTSNNVGDNDIGRDSPSNYSHRFYKLTNPVLGSNIRDMWRKTRGTSGAVGVLETWKAVKPRIVDTNLSGIENVKIHVRDNPSQYAKKAYLANDSADYLYGWHKITSGTSSVDPVVTVFHHGFTTGDIVVIRGLEDNDGRSGKDIANGRKKITVIDSDTFSITQVDGTKVIGNVAQQLLQSTSITNISNSNGRILLTVNQDLRSSLTAAANGSGSRLHINGVVGGADLTAVLNDASTLHNVHAITATSITLSTSFPSGANTYTSGGTINQVLRSSVNTTTEYDYLDNREYIKTTDSTGDVEEFEILTSTQVKEYGADEPTASVDLGGPWDIKIHANGSWRDRETDSLPVYGDWDTDKFDGYYKPDRRGNTHASTDDFTFSFCSYDHLLSTSSQFLNGKDTLEFQWVLFSDSTISDTRASTDVYTKIDTARKFYNKAKAFLVDNYDGENQTIVSRDGNTINAGYNNVVVSSNAGLAGGAIFDYTKETAGDITDDTTNQTPVVTKTGTGSNHSNHPVDHIINNNTNTALEKWLITSASSDSGVIISDLNSAIVTGLKITSSDVSDRDPRSYQLYGSNDGTTWTLIHSRKIPYYTSRYSTQTFNFKNTNRYTQYKILFPTIRSGDTLAVQEIELVGVTIEGTITIETDNYVGNIQQDGYSTSTLEGDAQVIGTFGANTVLPWTVKNIEATTRIQLYNMTSPRQGVIYTNKYSGTPGEYVDVSGTYDQTEIQVGDVVRLRCTCVVGAQAMLPTEITTVATETGIVFSVEQAPDTIYNSNGIDGSTLDFGGTTADSTRTLSADYVSPMGIDVSDADGTASVKQIYAFFVYSTTTEDGVDLWFKGMRAIDNANYEIDVDVADIKVQNVGSNAVVVSDGRLFRSDQTSVLYAAAGDKPISMDSGALVTSVQPQVEAVLNSNSKISKINTYSNLIPGLL